MPTPKKIYFAINKTTQELKGPYTKKEITELYKVSVRSFRLRFGLNDKIFRPEYVHIPISNYFIIRDTELDKYKNVDDFINISKQVQKSLEERRTMNINDRKLKGVKKILKSDVFGMIPKFKIKTLDIYTGEVKHYSDARVFSETENYLLGDILECVNKRSLPIFHCKLLILKYTTAPEKPFRDIEDFKSEVYYPDTPVILETNMKTKEEKVYVSGNEVCKHIPFDVGDLMFGLRYECGFSFNEYFYKLINN